MSICSTGTLTSEVEAYLGLKTAIDNATADGARLELLVLGVESWLKEETGRAFEQATYTDEAYDIGQRQDSIILTDYPVTTFTSLKRVDSLASDGTPDTTTTLDADTYATYTDEGIVRLRSGYFSTGLKKYLLTYVAGYTTTQITNNSAAEVRIWKQLELGIIAREYGLAKKNKRHLRSISFGDESNTFQFDLDFMQQRLLNKLKRGFQF
jgi:hypothetical protein